MSDESSRGKATFDELVAVMDRLREPGGCPWDREQDWASLRQFIVEEAYEVVEAIEEGQAAKLAEECGDLLFQVVFLSRIAAEQELFDVYDVITAIRDKLIRRHPHVFGEVDAKTPDDVLRNWEAFKDQERAEEGRHSALDGVPAHLPALMRGFKLGQKAARAGFDWDDTGGVLSKVDEELGELREALNGGKRSEIAHELGDVLFVLTSLARFVKVNPEDVCREASARFERRFRAMELQARVEGHPLKGLKIDELERRWQEAKMKEGG